MIPIIEGLPDGCYQISGIAIEKSHKPIKVSDGAIQALEKEYNKSKSERNAEVFEFIKEVNREHTSEMVELKNESIKNLTQRYEEIVKHIENSTWRGNPTWMIECFKEISNPNKILKDIKKLYAEIDFLEGKKLVEEGKITEQDIVGAKKHPFENLVELKHGKCICPFHNEDTASFSVHKEGNFGHCFGCGWSGDTIKFVMDSKNIKFIDAVKMLK